MSAWRIADEDADHIFIDVDLTLAGVGEVLEVWPCRFTYTDPPWGPGWLRGYATKAGILPSTDYPGFLASLARLVRPTGDAFIEMGHRWQGDLINALNDEDATIARVWPITYGTASKPAMLTRVLWQGEDPRIHPGPVDINDRDTPGWVMDRMPAGRVFDPCTGLGTTPFHAAIRGRPSLSLELNPVRLDRAMTRVEKVIGRKRERIR